MGFLDLFNDDDEEESEGGNLSRSTRNPYIMNLGQSSNDNKYNYQSGKITNPYSDPREHTGSRVTSYGDENKVNEYLDLSRRSNPSEEMYNEYLSRRPKEENYRAGFGRTLLAALAGGLGGALKNPYAMGLGQRILHAPYEKALADYRDEGQLLTNRARSADAAMQRDLAARKFDIEENRRRQDALSRNEMEQARFEEAKKNKESSDQRQIEKDIQTRQNKERDFRLRERSLNESSAFRRQHEAEMSDLRQENQRFKVEDRRNKQAQFAKLSAHQMIKSKPEYAQYFNDLTDDEDFSLKNNIPESKKAEIEFMIRDAEDEIKKKYGLPDSFMDQGYQDVMDDMFSDVNPGKSSSTDLPWYKRVFK